MSFELAFIIGAAAVWRLTSLLVREGGPGDIFARLRDVVGVTYDEYSICRGRGVLAAFCCIWCMSIWVAAPVAGYFVSAYHYSVLEGLAIWLALSTGAILIDKCIEARSMPL
jgi:hypothetical protein